MLGTKIDTQGTILAEIRTLNVKLVEQIQSLHTLNDNLVEEFRLLRRESRLILALFVLLAGLGLLGWLPQSCSRRGESLGGAEASQTDPERGADALNSLPREPSAESLETDAGIKADGDRSASDPDATR